jgi:peptide/nickel transport system permease protein
VAAENIRLEVAAPIRRARKPAVGGPPWLAALVDFGRRRTLGAAGGLVIVLMLAMALFANIIAPYDPLDTSFLAQLKPPSSEHLIGTDAFGRDVFSRLIYGSRTALTIGFGAAFVGASLGALLGVISAYFGGKIDLTIERLMDVLISFPLLILAIAVVTVLGPGPFNSGVIIAITVPIIPRVARVIRASALSIRRMLFVEAARCIGASPWRIMLRQVAPQCLAPVLVVATLNLGTAIFAEAALSFLGLGIQPPEASWGLILSQGRAYMGSAWWLVTLPGLAILLSTLSANLLASWIRAITDPVQRWRWI